LGKMEDAITDYTSALNIEPNFAEAMHQRGWAFIELDTPQRALNDFNQAVAIAPKYAEAYKARASLLVSHGKIEPALDDYDKTIELAPDDVEAINEAAWIRATCADGRFRDVTKAIQLARSACEKTQWREPVFLDTYAAALAAGGEFTEAVKWQSRALELSGGDLRPDLQSRLRLYQQRTSYRESLRR